METHDRTGLKNITLSCLFVWLLWLREHFSWILPTVGLRMRTARFNLSGFVFLDSQRPSVLPPCSTAILFFFCCPSFVFPPLVHVNLLSFPYSSFALCLPSHEWLFCFIDCRLFLFHFLGSFVSVCFSVQGGLAGLKALCEGGEFGMAEGRIP